MLVAPHNSNGSKSLSVRCGKYIITELRASSEGGASTGCGGDSTVRITVGKVSLSVGEGVQDCGPGGEPDVVTKFVDVNCRNITVKCSRTELNCSAAVGDGSWIDR